MPENSTPPTPQVEPDDVEHLQRIRAILENTGKNARENTAELIRKARVENGLTQAEVAEKLNRRQAYISDLETGKAEPGISTLAQLALLFHVPIRNLLPDEWPHPDREPPRLNELTEREAALIERLRQLHSGFSFHLALRLINTVIDIDRENEEFLIRIDGELY